MQLSSPVIDWVFGTPMRAWVGPLLYHPLRRGSPAAYMLQAPPGGRWHELPFVMLCVTMAIFHLPAGRCAAMKLVVGQVTKDDVCEDDE